MAPYRLYNSTLLPWIKELLFKARSLEIDDDDNLTISGRDLVNSLVAILSLM